MSCPACGGNLPGGQERCPACGAHVAPLTEGALAPDPAARSRPEPLREIPGLKKRERTWKDEVRERMRDRKRKRGDGDLPLFRDGDDAEGGDPEPASEDAVSEAPEPVPSRTPLAFMDARPAEVEDEDADLPLRPAELPLRAPAGTAAPAPELRLAAATEPTGVRSRSPEPAVEPADEWSLGNEPADAARPVERPAYSGERARAAALDVALLTVLWAIVVYFAGRAAHVELAGLRPAWPYLAGYLAFLGLTYAGYFTGTTGQTLGKIAVGLRVVDAGGRPPGYLRAFVRAALGSVGVLAAGAGLIPMLVDPARRALHDRVLRTRVVKG
ncbi:MAG TPA: RDD family protein [Vicinamibacteria bacterium]|nr:RDD family protein [Vicinamibacteria bacterium]